MFRSFPENNNLPLLTSSVQPSGKSTVVGSSSGPSEPKHNTWLAESSSELPNANHNKVCLQRNITDIVIST